MTFAGARFFFFGFLTLKNNNKKHNFFTYMHKCVFLVGTYKEQIFGSQQLALSDIFVLS